MIRHSVARYMIKLVRWAYSQAGAVSPPCHAHDVRKSAASTMGLLLDWLEAHMPEDDPDPRGGARLLLTIIEGSQMLDAVGRADIAEAGLAALEG